MTRKQGMKIFSVMIIIALVLFTGGCQNASDELAEKMIESATGGNVELDTSDDSISLKTDKGTLDIGAEKEWPNAIPSHVPRFSDGEIMSVMETNSEDGLSVSVGIKQTTAKYFEKYKSEVQGAGWDITSSIIDSDIYVFTAVKDKDLVMATFGEDEGGLSGSITYSQEK